jgi:hypothetical protein
MPWDNGSLRDCEKHVPKVKVMNSTSSSDFCMLNLESCGAKKYIGFGSLQFYQLLTVIGLIDGEKAGISESLRTEGLGHHITTLVAATNPRRGF